MKVIWTLAALLILLTVGGLAFIYSGLYNIAAVEPHTRLTGWVLKTVKNRSIHVRIGDIEAPPLDDEKLIEEGLVHFHQMCVSCHGAPGIPPSEVGQGLYPEAPDLVEEGEEESAEELFWVTRNGIKMTGMPAFGPTHTDEQIWAIVALLKSLHRMGETEYLRRVTAAGLDAESAAQGHSHESGGDGKPEEDGNEPSTPGTADEHDHNHGDRH